MKLGNISGGLRSIDCKTLECKELKWVRLMVDEGDVCGIPRLISVADLDKVYPVVVTIERELSMVHWGSLDLPFDGRRSSQVTGMIASVS